MNIKYLGQCGFVLESEQLRVAIDPVLNDLLDEEGKTLRCYPSVMEPENLKVHYLLCTHPHIDHLAVETVQAVARSNPKTLFVVPKGCVSYMKELGISSERVLGVSDGEVLSLEDGELTITGVSTAHPVHQLNEEGLDENLAYSICFGGKRAVHLGDTYHTKRLQDSLVALGSIDVLFTPINGRDEEREARDIIGNLSCEESADLAIALQVQHVIPTHFDMIIGNTEDPKIFEKLLKEKAPNMSYWIPTFDKDFEV